MTEFWALIETDLGESRVVPGGLFKIEGGLCYLLTGADEWTEMPHLIAYKMLGESGAEPIPTNEAQALIADYPWPGSRADRHAHT